MTALNGECLTNALVLVSTVAYIVSSLRGNCWLVVHIRGNLFDSTDWETFAESSFTQKRVTYQVGF
jgi:hypothetical protein